MSALQYYTYDSTYSYYYITHTLHTLFCIVLPLIGVILSNRMVVVRSVYLTYYILYRYTYYYIRLRSLRFRVCYSFTTTPFSPTVACIYRQQQQIVYYICCGYTSCARIKQENIFSFPVLCAPRESTVSVPYKGRTHKCVYVCVCMCVCVCIYAQQGALAICNFTRGNG